MIINDSQWYLTKLVGEVFLRYNNSCYMSMIFVVRVIQVIQLIQVLQVRSRIQDQGTNKTFQFYCPYIPYWIFSNVQQLRKIIQNSPGFVHNNNSFALNLVRNSIMLAVSNRIKWGYRQRSRHETHCGFHLISHIPTKCGSCRRRRCFQHSDALIKNLCKIRAPSTLRSWSEETEGTLVSVEDPPW